MKLNWNVILKRVLAVAAFCAIAVIGLYHYKAEAMTESIASKIIRFHVLANSDSKEDQELKLKVRDAVGAYMQQELSDISDVEESRRVILRDMQKIICTAKNVIQREGYDYEVTASLTDAEFPEKTYGEFTFPAGDYEALQVVIGDGGGKNWWCVMFPNLCFYNSMYEVVDEEAEKSLKKVLTTQEYASIMESGDYEVKFRWLSFLDR